MGTGVIFSVGGFLSELSGLASSHVLFLFLFLERLDIVSWISFESCGMGLCPGWTVHSAGI